MTVDADVAVIACLAALAALGLVDGVFVHLVRERLREAAEREAISISGMKSRVQRGRRLLRELFEACCEIALDTRGKPTDFAPRAPPGRPGG